MSDEDPEYQPRWNELITLPEAAKISGLSLSQLSLLAGSGEIWARKLGTSWFTTEPAIRAYLDHKGRSEPETDREDD